MRFLRASAILFLILAPVSTAWAQETIKLPKGNISGFGTFAASKSDGLDGGQGFGISGAYFFTDVLGVEGSFRRHQFDVEPTSSNNLAGGDLGANVISINLMARLASGSVQPYATGGVAFYLNDYSTTGTDDLAQFNFTANESVENAVGINIGGGVDFVATQRIGFFVEVRASIATADTAGGLTDDFTGISSESAGEQQLNVVSVNGGIRIFF